MSHVAHVARTARLPSARSLGVPPCVPSRGHARPRVEQLVARLYRTADPPLQARLLACLVRPLSPLALVAVAAGAFAGFLQRGDSAGSQRAGIGAVRYSQDQVMELARFVEQVQPQALQEFAALVAGAAAAGFNRAAALLLLRTLRARPGATPWPESLPRSAQRPGPAHWALCGWPADGSERSVGETPVSAANDAPRLSRARDSSWPRK